MAQHLPACPHAHLCPAVLWSVPEVALSLACCSCRPGSEFLASLVSPAPDVVAIPGDAEWAAGVGPGFLRIWELGLLLPWPPTVKLFRVCSNTSAWKLLFPQTVVSLDWMGHLSRLSHPLSSCSSYGTVLVYCLSAAPPRWFMFKCQRHSQVPKYFWFQFLLFTCFMSSGKMQSKWITAVPLLWGVTFQDAW